MSNASGNGAEVVLLALSIFIIGVLGLYSVDQCLSTRIGACVFVTCPTYEGGILQLGEHVNKKRTILILVIIRIWRLFYSHNELFNYLI